MKLFKLTKVEEIFIDVIMLMTKLEKDDISKNIERLCFNVEVEGEDLEDIIKEIIKKDIDMETLVTEIVRMDSQDTLKAVLKMESRLEEECKHKLKVEIPNVLNPWLNKNITTKQYLKKLTNHVNQK